MLLALPTMRIFRRAFSSSTLAILGRPERLSLVSFDLQAQSVHHIDQAGMAYFYAEGASLPVGLSDFFSSFGVILVFAKTTGGLLADNLKRAGAERVILLPSFPCKVSKMHVADYLVDSLGAWGFEKENSFHLLQLPEDALDFARCFFGNVGVEEGKEVLAIHPGSGSPAKNWSPENFALVADSLSGRARILLLSGPAQDGVAEVRRGMKRASPLVAENLPLLHLAALLQRSTAYLGNDSGITHLAAALGVPTVAIFGPTDPAIWGPQGPEVRILYEKKSCSLCSPEARTACSPQCLKSIEPDRVLEVLSALFK